METFLKDEAAKVRRNEADKEEDDDDDDSEESDSGDEQQIPVGPGIRLIA